MSAIRTLLSHPLSVLFSVAAFAIGIVPGYVQAQEQNLVLEEVIVTATKRAENVQDVPISITTLSEEAVQVISSGVPDIRFLNGRVANLGVESSYGRVFPRFYIRGYGNTDFDLNASQPVSVIVDEVIMENPITKGFPIFDVDRIEVLRGPQGTLFGRNTPAGIVKIDSVKPSAENDGYFRASYGTYGQARIEGALGGGWDNGWSGRLSVLYFTQDDWVNNTYTGVNDDLGGFDEWAARLQFGYDNGDNFTALISMHAHDLDGSAILFRANTLQPGTGRINYDLYEGIENISTDGTNFQRMDQYGGVIQLQWDLGRTTLTSVTGYETVDLSSRGDIDGGWGGCAVIGVCGPGFIPFDAQTEDGLRDHGQFTEEIRLSSNDWGRLDWIVGLFYFDEKFAIDTFNYDTLFTGDVNGIVYQHQDAKSYAVFGSVDYDVTEQFQVRAGLRWTHDDKNFVAERFLSPLSFLGVPPYGPVYANPDDDQTTWDLSGTWFVNDDVNLYARVATGFRAPSVQGRLLFGDTVSVANSETSISYEMGVKSTLADGRARLNFDVFYYTVDDAQLTAVGGETNFNQVINANEVEGSGFELDGQFFVMEDLQFTFSVGYVDTEIKDPNLQVAGCGAPCTLLDPPGTTPPNVFINGNPLPQSPKWTGSFIVDWRHQLESGQIYAIADYVYRDEINYVLYEAAEYTGKALGELGLRVGYNWNGGVHDLSVYGRNITDEEQNIYTIDFNNLTGVINDPAVWGLEYQFTY